jgi:hypothetical protein
LSEPAIAISGIMRGMKSRRRSRDGGLSRENEAVLAGGEALLGLISPNIVAVGLEFLGERITLRYWTEAASPESDDDMGEALDRFEELMGGLNAPPLGLESRIGYPEPGEWLRPDLRMIFGKKRPATPGD